MMDYMAGEVYLKACSKTRRKNKWTQSPLELYFYLWGKTLNNLCRTFWLSLLCQLQSTPASPTVQSTTSKWRIPTAPGYKMLRRPEVASPWAALEGKELAGVPYQYGSARMWTSGGVGGDGTQLWWPQCQALPHTSLHFILLIKQGQW